MPTICMFRGIKIYINYQDHVPSHFHAEYGEYECSISIDTSDAFNVTRLDDVLINRYEATDTPDGYVYEICLHGELIREED